MDAGLAEQQTDGLCVAIVRTRDEFARCLREPAPGIEWLQVEGLIGDPEAWALAAQGSIDIPVDVVLDDPAAEFSSLYRLVDVSNVRAVSVTIPAKPGLMKALRLAASLGLHVRLLPGQPDAGMLAELREAAEFYLHDSMVNAPVEFFHSLLGSFRGTASGTLWTFLEQDPAQFRHCDPAGEALHPQDFVTTHLAGLEAGGAECAGCEFKGVCAGYFKWPDASYDCSGIRDLLSVFARAADEITRELEAHESLHRE